MGGLEHGQRLYATNSAAAVVCIRHKDAESALPKAVLSESIRY